MEFIGPILYDIFAFIVILTVIVFSHEFGHYYIAKIFGVKIEEFSIGFGPEIFGRNDKSGTRWKVCYLPLGGYVKMFGDINPASVPDKEKIKKLTPEEEKVAFHSKPLAVKAAVVAAGPFANIIFAILILTCFFFAYGKPETTSVISSVSEDSAALEAGIRAGDEIIEMDGTKIDNFSGIQRVIAINTGTPIEVKIKRETDILDLVVTPKIVLRKDIFGNEVKLPMLGVSSQELKHDELNILESFITANQQTYFIVVGTLKAIGQMITGARDLSEITGPIGIAKYSGQSFDQGLQTILWFMVILSINLGLVNLFPIPVLDGGHLMYYAIEAFRGKPLADKYQAYGIKFGLALIITLAIFAVVNDIMKFSN